MTTSTEGPARWIVITPTANRADWFDAIKLGAHLAGKDTVATWLDGYDQGRSAKDIVVVTDDAAMALENEASDIVVLMPDPWSASEAIEATTGTEFPASAVQASQWLAQAADLAPRYRIVGSNQMHTPGAPLELFSDIIVKTPSSVSAHGGGSPRPGPAGVFRDFYAKGSPEDVASNWPLELLAYHTASLIDGRLGQFDLTGRPRFLVTGPYLWMPAGTWTAKVRFGLDDDASRRRFRLDWGGVEHWTEQYFTPDHGGNYEMELTHTFARAEPCEVRLVITEGCFTGRVDFISVMISKVMNAG